MANASMTNAHPHFSAAEFAGRVDRLRGRLRTLGVEAALFDEIEAMAWIAGYGNSENRWRCVAVPVEKEPFYLIRALDAGPCRRRTWIADIPHYRDWEDPFPVLAERFADRGLSRARVGLDFNSYGMPIARFARLKAALPQVEFVDIGPLVWELRLIKSEAEIGLLRRAAKVADETMKRVAEGCRRGLSQREAARIAVASYVELGADPAQPGPISAGRGWDFLHAHLEDTPLVDGDVVHVELTPSVGGYSARLMRCVCIGPIEPERRRAAQTLAALQDRQIAAMRPDAEARAVDAILREGVLKEGLRQSFDNISGYTLGFYAPAGPRTSDFTRIFHPKADWRLEPGMVFHMYASAAGVSFSETVLVSADGPQRLGSLPRELMGGV
jgi:Xaa-Pro aminopeptidase